MIKEKRLAKEIRLLGHSYESFGKLLGVSKQSVSNWINEANRISPVMVVKMQEFGITKAAIRNPSEMV